MQLNVQSVALIATEDGDLSHLARMTFDNLHYKSVIIETDSELLQRIESDRPDILILDFALPNSGGARMVRKLRQNPDTAEIPIIMLTSAKDGNEKVESLDAGADCCISKPLQIDVLAAYVRALRRRIITTADHNILHAGPIEMDLGRWMVKVAGQRIDLTKIEFSLLRELLGAKGRALTRDFLLQKVWPHGTIHGLDTRTVDVHIGRLRRKLGRAGRYIITVRNVGFRFDLLPDWISSHHAS